ncbi:hypothetical protein Tco_0409432 [Tanacetum coccineum]
MSGKYGTSNAGAEFVGVSDCNKVYKEAGNEAVMSISVDDCIDLDGMERSILAKVKDLSVISELLKHMSSEGFDDVGLRYVGGRWVWLEFDSMDQVESVKTSKALKEIFLEFKDVSHDFIPDERCVWIDHVVLHWHPWLQRFKEVGWSVGKQRVYGYIPPKMLTMIVSPSSRVLREEDVPLGGSDLVDTFEEGEIRDDYVLL